MSHILSNEYEYSFIFPTFCIFFNLQDFQPPGLKNCRIFAISFLWESDVVYVPCPPTISNCQAPFSSALSLLLPGSAVSSTAKILVSASLSICWIFSAAQAFISDFRDSCNLRDRFIKRWFKCTNVSFHVCFLASVLAPFRSLLACFSASSRWTISEYSLLMTCCSSPNVIFEGLNVKKIAFWCPSSAKPIPSSTLHLENPLHYVF